MRFGRITIVVAALLAGCGADHRLADASGRTAPPPDTPPSGDAAPTGDRCGACDLQLRECEAHRGSTCAGDEDGCRELCLALERRRDAEPGGPCPCAPGLCCQSERCVRNELVYFSPYEPLSGEVAPEDSATVLRGIVMLCALEEEPPVAGIPAVEQRGCPPAGEVPSEPANAATGTVLIAQTVGEPRDPPRLKPPDPTPSLARAAVIARIIHNRARPAILACYRAALAECPGLAGVLQVGFTVADDGAAQGVEPLGPGLFPELDACVVDAVRSLAFPLAELSHLKITWPFTFIPIRDLSTE